LPGIIQATDDLVAARQDRVHIKLAALVGRIAQVLRARGVPRLEVTANPHAMRFYRAAGFVDCGVADTVFGAAPRMMLPVAPP
jgi:hypothetical protein